MTTPGRDNLRFLLLQMRDAGDPMLRQEVQCFADALPCSPQRITPHSLLAGGPSRDTLGRHDMVLIGGSGAYSAAADSPAIERAMDALRELHALRKPTFGSCWGFQALARALGGECRHDPQTAELGPVQLTLTPGAAADPVFRALPATFIGHAGHEDRVTRLPPGSTLLASSARVAEQAARFGDGPIYATQFHPELTRQAFLQRVAAYPKYIEAILGISLQQLSEACVETPEANTLLRRMVEVVLP